MRFFRRNEERPQPQAQSSSFDLQRIGDQIHGRGGDLVLHELRLPDASYGIHRAGDEACFRTY